MIAPRACFVPLECSDGTRPTKAIVRGAEGKRRGSPSSAAIVERGEIIDAAEAAQPLRRAAAAARASSRPRRSSSTARSRATASSTARRYAACVWSSAGSGHVCARSQASCALRPRLLRPGEAAAVPQEEFREPMPRAQEIRANIFATAEQIARRFFLLGRDMNRRQRAGAIQHRELRRHRADRSSSRSPARRGIKAGAITSHGTPCAVSARCSSKPHGPAS